jgi:MFS family permease
MMAFVPVFFFASEYAQISLGKSASGAGLFLLYFFLGFVVAAQIGGRMLDRVGAKRPVVFGCVIAAVGFALWAGKVTQLDFGSQVWFVVLAGAGMGMMLGPASTDAVNRASRLSYGEATGITQTVRNYAASLGLAVLGTVQVSVFRSHLTTSLTNMKDPQAKQHAAEIAQAANGGGGGKTGKIEPYIALDFAHATQVVLYCMCAIMAVAGLVGLRGLRRGVQEDLPSSADSPEPGAAAPAG